MFQCVDVCNLVLLRQCSAVTIATDSVAAHARLALISLTDSFRSDLVLRATLRHVFLKEVAHQEVISKLILVRPDTSSATVNAITFPTCVSIVLKRMTYFTCIL